jgi:hypothetical protein
MKINYYVVLPNLNLHDRPRKERCAVALLEMNKKVLAEGVKFFTEFSEAKAYMSSCPLTGKFHSLVQLGVEHNEEPFLTTINGVKRFYSIATFELAVMRPSHVLKLYRYPLEKQLELPVSPPTLPKACTPFSDASDPSLALSSSSSAKPSKAFEAYKVLSDLPCFVKGFE